jgi:hypothetical protein
MNRFSTKGYLLQLNTPNLVREVWLVAGGHGSAPEFVQWFGVNRVHSEDWSMNILHPPVMGATRASRGD